MKLPPPPPAGKRFIQILSPDGESAVRSGSGPVYEGMIQALQESNPGCFESDAELGEYLRLYLWPPVVADTICEDFPHIPRFPSSLKFVEGRKVGILIADPVQLLDVLGRRGALKTSFAKHFGGPAGLADMRRRFVAEGRTSDHFDEFVAAEIARAEERMRIPWWKFWSKR